MRIAIIILLSLAMFGLGIIVREASWTLSAVLGVVALVGMLGAIVALVSGWIHA